MQGQTIIPKALKPIHRSGNDWPVTWSGKTVKLVEFYSIG